MFSVLDIYSKPQCFLILKPEKLTESFDLCVVTVQLKPMVTEGNTANHLLKKAVSPPKNNLLKLFSTPQEV